MKTVFKLILELVVRYVCASVVGLGYLGFDSVFAGRFMNHLGMHGNILSFDLGIFMIYEVPIWMLVVWLFKLVAKGPLVEIVIAGIVAVVTAQFMYFDLYWSNVILPTVDSGTKGMMLFWYVATITNYMLATLAATLYCIARSIWFKRKSRTAGHG